MADNNLAVRITADAGQLVSEMSRASSAVTASTAKMADAANYLKGALVGMAGAASAGGMVSIIKQSIDAADALNDLSQRVGISVKDLAGYELAAKQSGTSLESIGKGVKNLANYMVEHGDRLKALGVDTTNANVAVKQLSDLFVAMPDGVQKTTLATTLFGKAGMDLIPMLNMGSEGLDKAAKSSERYAALMAAAAPEADKFNDQVATLATLSSGLGVSIATEMLPAMNDITAAMIQAKNESGTLMSLWVGLGGIGAAIFTDEFAGVQKQIANVNGEITKLQRHREQVGSGGLIDQLLFGSQAEIDAKLNGLQARLAELSKPVTTSKTNEADSPEAKAKAYAERYKKTIEEAFKLLNPVTGAGKAAGDVIDERLEALILRAGQESANLKLLQKDIDSVTKAREEYEKQVASVIDPLNAQASALEREVEFYGMTESAIQATIIARREEELVVAASVKGNQAQVETLEKEIEARKRIAAAAGGKEALDASKKAAEASAESWKKGWEETDRLARDVFTDWATDGSSAAKKIGDTLKKALLSAIYEATIKPIAFSIYNSVTGGSAGATGAAGSVMGAANSASSLYSNASSLYNYGASAVSYGSTALGYTYGTNAFSQQSLMLASQDAGFTAGAGAGSSTLGAAATAVGWLAVAYMVLDYFGSAGGAAKVAATALSARKANGELSNPLDAYGLTATDTTIYARPTNTMDARDGFTDLSDGGGIMQSNAYMADSAKAVESELVGGFASALQQSLNLAARSASQYVEKLGGTLPDMVYSLFADQDPGGTAPDSVVVGANWTDSAGKAQSFNSAINGDRGQTAATVTTQLQRLTLATVAAAEGLPPVFQDYIATVNVATATTEQLTAAMTEMTKIDALRQGFVRLGAEADSLTLSLIQAAGGTDALAALTSSYYDNFYSESEKQANALEEVGKELAAMGMALPTTRDGFRDLVEQQYALGTAGEANVVALLQLSSAFANVVPATEAAAEAVTELGRSMEDIARERASLQNALDQAQGNTAAIRARELAALDDSNKALQQQIWAIEDAKTAAEALAAAQAETTQNQTAYTEAVKAAQSTLASAYKSEVALKNSIASAMSGYVRSLQSFRNSLLLGADSTLSPEAKYAEARAQLEDVQRRAAIGDTAAFDALQPAAQAFLAASKDYNATNEQYGRDFAWVQGVIGDSQTTAERIAASNLAQARDLQVQIDLLDRGIEATLSVADAIRTMQAAVVAALQSGVGLNAIPAASAAFNGAAGQWNPLASGSGSYYQSAGGALGVMNNGASDYTAYGVNGTSASGSTILSTIDSLLAAGNERGIYDQWKAFGGSLSDLDKIKGWTAGTASAWASANGLPSYDVGTNIIPFDQIARVHRGEQIKPAAYVDMDRQAREETNALLRAVLTELKADKTQRGAASAATVQALAAVVDRLDGNKRAIKQAAA